MGSRGLTTEQIAEFHHQGYLVIRSAAAPETVEQMLVQTKHGLQQSIEPFELEADVRYPGSPASRDAEGGKTIRRLLQAYERHAVFRNWARSPDLLVILRQLLDSETVWLNPSHHNCVMTKQPRYSSKTMWHQDVRYWRFSEPRLVNVWLAMGDETAENGGMWVIPESHKLVLQTAQLDEDKFLIPDHADNKALIGSAKQVLLARGDMLLFDARCFHAAGQNRTDASKFSLVMTYHGDFTQPEPGTKSASRREIQVV